MGDPGRSWGQVNNNQHFVSDIGKNHVEIDIENSQRPAMPVLLDYGFRPPLIGKNVWLTPEQASWSFCLPFIGRIRIVKDPIGILCAFFILFYWVYNVGCSYYIIMLPRYREGSVSIILLIIYGTLAFQCISSFFKAATMNPGALPSASSPESDWNTCIKCDQARAPGTHHCRRCGQCVRKMDHHCPWINNCVGEDNQFAFMLLVMYAQVLSMFCLILDVFTLYNYLPCFTCSEITFLGIGERKLLWASVVMAVFMSSAGMGLYMTQHLSILFQTPSMEFNRMQLEFLQTGRLPQIWPVQRRSAMSAYKDVCGQRPKFFWLCPCRRRNIAGFYPKENFV